MKKLLVRLAILAAVTGVVLAGFYFVQKIPKKEQEIPTATVKRGDLEVRTYLRGELRAVRSMTLTAPNLGSQSQITRLASAGSLADAKDLIVEFDDSERRAQLEDALLEVQKVEQALVKSETDLAIRKSQDDVAVVKAKYAVTKAELENRKNELVGAIEARKNQLSLEEAHKAQDKLHEDIKSRLQQSQAELGVIHEQLTKAKLDSERERRRIEQARVLTPIAGLVSVLENRSGGRGGFGQATPVIREGDQIPAGMAVAQILDLSEMELVAKVEEVERANLKEGQEAVIYLDALPGKAVDGKIKTLGTTATTNVFRGEATKKFDTILSLDMNQLLKNVGASDAQIRRILETAKENARRGVFGNSAPIDPLAIMQEGAGAPGAGPRFRTNMAPGGPGGGDASADGGPADGQRRGNFGRNLSPEQRTQMQQAMQKALGGRDISQLSPEERRQLFQKIRPQGGGNAGGGNTSEPPVAGVPPTGTAPAGPVVRNMPPGAAQGSTDGGSMPEFATLSLIRPGAMRFTPEDRANAELPAPPEQGSDVDILLRPGLLANAEIIVEQIKNTLYVPFQGIFEIGGQHVVYVKKGDRFETRKVEIGQRSESQIAIKSGLEEGEEIALAPPDEEGRNADKKKKAQQEAQPSFPGAGGGEAAPPAGGGRRKR